MTAFQARHILLFHVLRKKDAWSLKLWGLKSLMVLHFTMLPAYNLTRDKMPLNKTRRRFPLWMPSFLWELKGLIFFSFVFKIGLKTNYKEIFVASCLRQATDVLLQLLAKKRRGTENSILTNVSVPASGFQTGFPPGFLCSFSETIRGRLTYNGETISGHVDLSLLCVLIALQPWVVAHGGTVTKVVLHVCLINPSMYWACSHGEWGRPKWLFQFAVPGFSALSGKFYGNVASNIWVSQFYLPQDNGQ